ncbi:F-box protein At2g02240-like [Rutidosis leptorrhynchoides]|uniref:F-box protein At2g02240-like n=1 Tax=Rutidosis leptorrhynchoides TaxID=125765 RepID=UPI003A9989CA
MYEGAKTRVRMTVGNTEFFPVEKESEKLKGVKQVLKSNLNIDQGQLLSTDKKSEDTSDTEKVSSLSGENVKKHLMLSAKEFLYNPPGLKSFHFEPSDEPRFQDVTELLQEQVIRIKYKIEIEKLSRFTEYACYLVFKLSEKCRGLYGPVKVRDLLNQKNTATKFIYFRSPAPYNQHDYANWVPKERKDGWMEVMVWNFNSKYKHGKVKIPMNLQLIAYEGTISGLIVCGLELRPK